VIHDQMLLLLMALLFVSQDIAGSIVCIGILAIHWNWHGMAWRDCRK
jgi:hypothetical protein